MEPGKQAKEGRAGPQSKAGIRSRENQFTLKFIEDLYQEAANKPFEKKAGEVGKLPPFPIESIARFLCKCLKEFGPQMIKVIGLKKGEVDNLHDKDLEAVYLKIKEKTLFFANFFWNCKDAEELEVKPEFIESFNRFKEMKLKDQTVSNFKYGTKRFIRPFFTTLKFMPLTVAFCYMLYETFDENFRQMHGPFPNDLLKTAKKYLEKPRFANYRPSIELPEGIFNDILNDISEENTEESTENNSNDVALEEEEQLFQIQKGYNNAVAELHAAEAAYKRFDMLARESKNLFAIATKQEKDWRKRLDDCRKEIENSRMNKHVVKEDGSVDVMASIRFLFNENEFTDSRSEGDPLGHNALDASSSDDSFNVAGTTRQASSSARNTNDFSSLISESDRTIAGAETDDMRQNSGNPDEEYITPVIVDNSAVTISQVFVKVESNDDNDQILETKNSEAGDENGKKKKLAGIKRPVNKCASTQPTIKLFRFDAN